MSSISEWKKTNRMNRQSCQPARPRPRVNPKTVAPPKERAQLKDYKVRTKVATRLLRKGWTRKRPVLQVALKKVNEKVVHSSQVGWPEKVLNTHLIS